MLSAGLWARLGQASSTPGAREGVSETVALVSKPGVWGGLRPPRGHCGGKGRLGPGGAASRKGARAACCVRPGLRAGSVHVPAPAAGDARRPSAEGRRDLINFAGGKQAGGPAESPHETTAAIRARGRWRLGLAEEAGERGGRVGANERARAWRRQPLRGTCRTDPGEAESRTRVGSWRPSER